MRPAGSPDRSRLNPSQGALVRFLRPAVAVRFALLALLALVVTTRVAAQRPGDELPTYERIHYHVLSEALGQVKEVLAEWRELQTNGDAKKVAKMFADDGFFSPV